MDAVFAELRHSLDCYVTWSAGGEKLEDCTDAPTNAVERTGSGKFKSLPSYPAPERYPDLRRTIQEAQKSLFLLDDRAPAGLVVFANVGIKSKWPSVSWIIQRSKIQSFPGPTLCKSLPISTQNGVFQLRMAWSTITEYGNPRSSESASLRAHTPSLAKMEEITAFNWSTTTTLHQDP